jgi:hypothetical protein
MAWAARPERRVAETSETPGLIVHPSRSAPLVGRLQLGAHARAGREAVAGVLLPQLGHEPLPEARSARLHEPG